MGKVTREQAEDYLAQLRKAFKPEDFHWAVTEYVCQTYQRFQEYLSYQRYYEEEDILIKMLMELDESQLKKLK